MLVVVSEVLVKEVEEEAAAEEMVVVDSLAEAVARAREEVGVARSDQLS
jgi:hypothetical protein